MTTTNNPDLSITLCDVRLPNPTVLASGILGLSHQVMRRAAEAGAGAVTTKSISLAPRDGYPNPSILQWEHGLINAVGLSNPGVEVMVDEIRAARKTLAPLGVPVIASIFADNTYDFGTVARYISEGEPDLIEINISCPNVDDEYLRMFAADPYVSEQVVRRVKKNTSIPVLVKLSPNVTDIVQVARAVEAGGADGITAVNSLGPGLILDVETARPILFHGTGGISGPAMRPIAVRCVRDICRAVRIPVIGVGGVSDGRDAVEMVLVGATAIGIGSAVGERGMGIFRQVCDGLQDYMRRHGYERLEEFRRRARDA